MTSDQSLLRLVEKSCGNPAREDLTTLHSRRGYRLVYRPGMDCPSCGRTHWLVGRLACRVCILRNRFPTYVKELTNACSLS